MICSVYIHNKYVRRSVTSACYVLLFYRVPARLRRDFTLFDGSGLDAHSEPPVPKFLRPMVSAGGATHRYLGDVKAILKAAGRASYTITGGELPPQFREEEDAGPSGAGGGESSRPVQEGGIQSQTRQQAAMDKDGSCSRIIWVPE